MKVEDLVLEQTCECCPEQYDVIYNEDRIGYIRYRSGLFTCQPVIENEIQHHFLVYKGFEDWNLTLHDDNREDLLLESKEQLVEFWNDFDEVEI